MGIKFTCSYLAGFLALIFFVHECHDWAHFFAAHIVCGCSGIKSFDNWTLCSHCAASSRLQVWIWFAGPMVTYIIIWLGWWLMNWRHTAKQQSLGFSFLFATIPFVRILAASAGGSDETYGLRQLFQHADKSNSHAIALTGLISIIILTGPPFLRAFIRLRNWKEKLILFPAFLLLPMFIDKWTYRGLNKIAATGFLGNEILPGISMLVIAWSLFLLLILLLAYKNIMAFLKPVR